jgi:hypothetical protein
MTDTEWVACQNILVLQRDYLARTNERQQLLYAAACVRHVWRLLPAHCRYAVETVERFADGHATYDEVSEALNTSYAPPKLKGMPPGFQQAYLILSSAGWRWQQRPNSPCTAMTTSTGFRHSIAIISRSAAEALAKVIPWEEARRRQRALLEDIGGKRSRSLTIAPSWLTWNDCCILNMARTAYDERAFSSLPILADALEDAGCDNADILNHCRNGAEHVRGCWVVDLLLGKE